MSVCAISAGRRSAACHFNRFDSFEIEKKTIFFLVSQIWLREALQCRNCGLVCHKKCIKRFPDRKWCGLDDFYIPTIPIAIDTPKVGCLVVEFIAFFRLSLFTKMGKP